SVYAASKHAVEGLTKSAAIEVAGRGVRVNAVAPGPIETGMLNRFTGTDERKAGLVATVPLHPLGTTEEIAQTIVFLASDKAGVITGASFAGDARRTPMKDVPRRPVLALTGGPHGIRNRHGIA